MIGFPDVGCELKKAVADALGAVREAVLKLVPAAVKKFVAEAKQMALNYLCKTAFDTTCEEWVEHQKDPAKYFDKLIAGKGANRESTTLEKFNRDVLHISAKGSEDDYKQKFDWQKLAPAFNTVQLTKLAFLDKDQVNRVLGDLADKIWAGDAKLRAQARSELKIDKPNIMLGWLSSIDASNQWCFEPPSESDPHHKTERVSQKRLVLAQMGGAAFPHVFYEHTGVRAMKCGSN
jgi:hypothetical protein